MLETIYGHRTWIAGFTIIIVWSVRLFMLSDEMAVTIMDGPNIGLLAGGVGVLLGLSKAAGAMQIKARRESE